MTSGTLEAGQHGVRAVVFDLFITLTDFEAERRRPALLRDLAQALGVDPSRFEGTMRETFTERATGVLGDLAATLQEVSRRCGGTPSPDALRTAAALRVEHELHVLTPRSGVIETLTELRHRGYKTAIVSDCTAEITEFWDRLPYRQCVDAWTFSFEVGARKPAPILYEHSVNQLSVRPAECLYVGDGGSDELNGAQAAGMVPLLLETPFGADVRYDAKDWTGSSIQSIEALLTLLPPR